MMSVRDLCELEVRVSDNGYGIGCGGGLVNFLGFGSWVRRSPMSNAYC